MSSSNKYPVITIDGESSTGKTVLSLHLATKLGFSFLNSGALYRALAYLKKQHPNQSLEAQLELLRNKLSIKIEDDRAVIYIGGFDISDALMDSDIAVSASKIATDVNVRSGLIPIQQSFCKAPGLVAEGRDMGAVIFPDADMKIYFTAPLELRVSRRYIQLQELGLKPDIITLTEELQQRDSRDRTRDCSPLQKPDGAIEFDTSGGNLEENKARLTQLVLSKLKI